MTRIDGKFIVFDLTMGGHSHLEGVNGPPPMGSREMVRCLGMKRPGEREDDLMEGYHS